MGEAVAEARKAAHSAEVPIGAVVVSRGEIIARAHNEVEAQGVATKHAELLALERASNYLKSWRLNESSIYVTLEPCSMCVGAMVLARVKELYFAARDPRQGAAGSLYDLTNFSGLPHQIKVYSGVMEREAQEILSDFFKKRRL